MSFWKKLAKFLSYVGMVILIIVIIVTIVATGGAMLGVWGPAAAAATTWGAIVATFSVTVVWGLALWEVLVISAIIASAMMIIGQIVDRDGAAEGRALATEDVRAVMSDIGAAVGDAVTMVVDTVTSATEPIWGPILNLVVIAGAAFLGYKLLTGDSSPKSERVVIETQPTGKDDKVVLDQPAS